MTNDQERQNVSSQEQQKRDSGAPGGGQGRIEDVSGSGVYPMSGPHPTGDVEIQPPASWGQGERGAESYQDSGTSELFGPDELQTGQ